MTNKEKIKNSLVTVKVYDKDLKALEGILALLLWDQEVYMPQKGIEGKARQTGYISKLSHEKLVSDELGQALEFLRSNSDKLRLEDKAIVRNLYHSYEKGVKIPTKLVTEIAETSAKSQKVWEEAKRSSDFDKFEPYLTKLVKLKRQVCEEVGYKDSPYDVLLDKYEPYMKEGVLNEVFSNLRDETIKVLNMIKGSKVRSKMDKIKIPPIPIDIQKKLNKSVVADLGFDFSSGRVDEAEHPFTTWIATHDIRFTTHYYEENFVQALMSSIHECGHSLYEQNRDERLAFTSLDEGVSLGIHESQSRTWENQIGRSKAFCKYFIKKARKLYKKGFSKLSADDLFLLLNEVKPGMIRIRADEVTYNLHIVLRFEIEKELIRGKIKPKDLNEIWIEKMREYLGIKPKNDAEGVLQDVHWSSGLFGYFPTYSLGNLYAAQFCLQMEKDIRDIDRKIEKGNFKPILKWLTDKIYRFGHIYTADELCRKVTGKELDSKYFVKYLNKKYGEIYC